MRVGWPGLRTRVVLLVILAVLPALALSLHTGLEERRAATERVRESTALFSRLASTHHARLIEGTRQFLATLAQMPEVRQAPRSGCDRLLATLLRQQPAYADFGVVDASGLPLCAGLPTASASRAGRVEIERAVEGRTFAVGEVEPSGIPVRPALRVALPIVDEANALRAVVWAALDLAWLSEFTSRAGLPPGGTLQLVDATGTVIARHPESDAAGRRNLQETELGRALAGAPGGSTVEMTGADGGRRLYVSAPLPVQARTPLWVVVGVPTDHLYAEANAKLLRTLAGMALVALLGVFAAWSAGDVFIVRRVNALLAAASELAAGRLDARTGLTDESGSLGQLAREFDGMAEALERRQREMERTTHDLRESEKRKAAIVAGSLDCIITTDAEGHVLEFNPAAERTFGHTRADAIGRKVHDLIVPPGHRREGESRMPALLGDGEAIPLRQRVEITAMRADGTEFPAEVSVTPIDFDDGTRLYTAFLRDITERRRAEEELRAARDELQRRVDARTGELKEANERLVDWVEELQQRAQDMRQLSEVGDHLQACHSVEEAYGVLAQYGRSLFPDQSGALCMINEGHTLVETVASWGSPPPPEEIFTPEDCWALRRARPHAVDGPDAHLVCRHVGVPPPASYVCVPMMAQGSALGILHLVETPREFGAGRADVPHHVTARRQLAFTVADQLALALSNLRLQGKLRDQAIRDPLTGLFNRRYMEESLEREMRRASRRGVPLGVIMLDIDHFKRFNDTFGHAAGDTLLKAIGELIQEHTRGEDIACRYGGEEFTLILLEASPEDTEERASLLREEASRLSVQHGSQPLGRVTMSLGVAVYPEHGHTGEELLRAADEALYRAKASGRDRVMVASAVAS